MMIPANDPLTLGLRTLAMLARRGPLDIARLARLHHSPVDETEAVVAVLEHDGLVHRTANHALLVLTERGAALVGEGDEPVAAALIVSSPAPPGRRGRIGIIQPAPGVMLEHEWPRWLPEGVLFPVGRMRMPGADRAGYAAMAGAAPEVARDLASAGAAVVAYACTVGSVYAGARAEAEMVTALAAAAGRPALALGGASMAALRWLGATRLLILTPYGVETNRWVADYAVEQGFAVAACVTTPVGIATIGDLAPAAIVALAVEALAAHPDADALWLPCTAMQTLDAIAAIEAVAGRPVVSGSQALLWQSLSALSIAADGPGSLFA